MLIALKVIPKDGGAALHTLDACGCGDPSAALAAGRGAGPLRGGTMGVSQAACDRLGAFPGSSLGLLTLTPGSASQVQGSGVEGHSGVEEEWPGDTGARQRGQATPQKLRTRRAAWRWGETRHLCRHFWTRLSVLPLFLSLIPFSSVHLVACREEVTTTE